MICIYAVKSIDTVKNNLNCIQKNKNYGLN